MLGYKTNKGPFLIATWVKQEDSAELAEQTGLWRRRYNERRPHSSQNYISTVFGGQTVGIREVADQIWLVSFIELLDT